MRKVVDAIVIAQMAFICGGSTAAVLIPLAAQERGYHGAIGGEWLLIIIATVVGAHIGNYLTAEKGGE